jgi:hypothetical protein
MMFSCLYRCRRHTISAVYQCRPVNLVRFIINFLSFPFLSATKSPRLIPVLLYSSRLANIAMGCMSYFFSAQKPMCKPETHDDFTVYIRSDIRPDGTKEMLEGSRRILPAFDSSPKDGKCRMPFHPHLSA